MLKDYIEHLINQVMLMLDFFGAWRLRAWWWNHIFHQRHQQVRAKFIQDNCDGMDKEKWLHWIDTLTTNEFIHVMLLDEPDDAANDNPQSLLDAITEVVEEFVAATDV